MSIINIIPVFNQTYEIWSNFARIEIDTLASVHKQFYTQDRAQVIIDLFKSAWDSNMNNFAFASFCKNKMVGFIRGNENMVYDLFVLPEYKGQGIGSKLLNYSEIINHNYKNFFNVICIIISQKFLSYK